MESPGKGDSISGLCWSLAGASLTPGSCRRCERTCRHPAHPILLHSAPAQPPSQGAGTHQEPSYLPCSGMEYLAFPHRAPTWPWRWGATQSSTDVPILTPAHECGPNFCASQFLCIICTIIGALEPPTWGVCSAPASWHLPASPSVADSHRTAST